MGKKKNRRQIRERQKKIRDRRKRLKMEKAERIRSLLSKNFKTEPAKELIPFPEDTTEEIMAEKFQAEYERRAILFRKIELKRPYRVHGLICMWCDNEWDTGDLEITCPHCSGED